MEGMDLGNAAAVIAGRIKTWEDGIADFLNAYEEMADAWRMRPPAKKGGKGGSFVNTRTSETLRAVEALSTSMFRMMTAADPYLEIVPLDRSASDEQVVTTETTLRMQLMKLKYKPKLLKTLRSGACFGTTVVEEPWASWPYGAAQPLCEGTDFVHRSLLQFAFDPGAVPIEWSDFYATIDWVTPERMRAMAKARPDIWDLEAVERAIDECKDTNKIPELVKARRDRAGYSEGLPAMQLVTFYGNPEGEPAPDGREWVIGVLNDVHVVRGHATPFIYGRPFRIAHFMEFELEALGYGAAKVARLAQKQLDGNRNRVHNIISMSLFNMWLVSELSGIKPNQFQIKPNGVIVGDDISENAIRPLRPLLEAANWGLQLDKILKEEHYGASGAFPNLQAIATQSTATEASIAQNEGIRRVSVTAECMNEELGREHFMTMHRNNMEMLEPGMWVASTSERKARWASRRTMVRDIEVFARTTTDKDFRPSRLAQLTQYLQTLLSVRSQVPEDIPISPRVAEILREMDRSFGLNPPRLSAQDMLMRKLKNAQEQAMRAPTPPPMGEEPVDGLAAGEAEPAYDDSRDRLEVL